MDRTELFNDVIKSKEFKSLLKRMDGKLTSSPIQIKSGTIQINYDNDSARRIIYANGYIRTGTYNGMMGEFVNGVTRKPAPDFDRVNGADYDFMIGQVNYVIGMYDRADAILIKKVDKVSKGKLSKTVIDFVFEPYEYDYSRGFENFPTEKIALAATLYDILTGVNKYTKRS